MQYNQPYGKPPEVTWGDTPYINGNPSTGTQGSIPPAASIEYPQRELVNFSRDTGLLTPSNSDLHQLSKGVMTGMMHYGVDAGVVNALQVNMQPAPDEYYDGMFVFVVVANTNSGASTVSLNGLAPCNIVRRGGGPLVAGDMPANYKSLLCYSKLHNNFELYGINFGGTGGFLPILTANTTWYINGTTGSDTLYDGTSATVSGPHGPFKTIGRGMQEISKYGPSAYNGTLSVAAGTYPEAVTTPNYRIPGVSIIGAGKTATFVTGANNTHTFQVSGGNQMGVQSLCGSCGTGLGPPSLFCAVSGGSIATDDTASSGSIPFCIWEAYAGYVSMGSHVFNAGCNATMGVFGSYFGGFIGQAGYPGPGKTWTFLGSFNAGAGGFAIAHSNGSFEAAVPGQTTFVNPGYVSGPKFLVEANGVINSQGLGINYFPGSTPGIQAYGGQYI
jgi:hypothetical protein